MNKNKHIRRALTMLELVVVIFIIGILVSLLLVGMHQVRDTAYRVDSQNNLKQIAMGLHNYAQVKNGRLPEISVGKNKLNQVLRKPSVFVSILPFVEQGNSVVGKPGLNTVVALFLSPADPTVAGGIDKIPLLTSYAANTEAFPENGRLTSTFRDGTANTILIAERYAYNCQGVSQSYRENEIFYSWPSPRRATFADIVDVRPITTGSPPVTGPSEWQFTFQAGPSINDCIPWLPQTPHRSGMAVALADGSSRVIAPTISLRTFWSAVTPASGEVLEKDW